MNGMRLFGVSVLSTLLVGVLASSSSAANGVTRPVVVAAAPNAPTMNATGNRPRWKNGLPPTVLDSFVYEAKEYREFIYGDEGVAGLPPYEWFTKPHRINAGIMDERDKGLTTNHGSYMPDAWGADEFLSPPGEWSQSGARGRTRDQGFIDGQPQQLSMDVRTGAVNYPPPMPPQGYGNPGGVGGAGGGDQGGGDGSQVDAGPQIPPPPGDGYMAVYQHGAFVGYIAPDEDMLQFVRSDRYLGGEMGARSIEYELGARSSPIF